MESETSFTSWIERIEKGKIGLVKSGKYPSKRELPIIRLKGDVSPNDVINKVIKKNVDDTK